MISVILGGVDITQAVKPPIRLEDDFTYGAVKATLDVKHVKKKIDIQCGMLLEIKVNKVLWFEGYTFNSGRTFSDDGHITVYDPLIYLIKSSADFEWRKKNATLISNELFGKYGIKINSVVSAGYIFPKLLCRAQDYTSIYTILLTVWYETKKRDEKKYWLRYENGAKVFVREPPGKVPVLQSLTHSEIEHSIEELVNEVHVIDREKNISIVVKNDESISKYGKITRVEDYTAENKSDARRYGQQVLQENAFQSSYKASAVVPVTMERLWCGDYVYTPDSDKVNYYGNYIKKITMDIYNSHIILDMVLQRTNDIPIMEIKEDV